MSRCLRLCVLALLALPATAGAAETVAADPEAREVTALSRTLVWTSGEGPGQRLMHRNPDGVVAQVARSGTAAWFRSPDLGRDSRGRLVLTYWRCDGKMRCAAYRSDLRRAPVKITGLALRDCALSTPPAMWRSRVAYGLGCWKTSRGRRVADDRRSGLYVRTGSGSPRRLATPRAAARHGVHDVSAVDIRGTRVAATYSDIYGYAHSVDSDGSDGRTSFVSASEGESDARVAGLALASTTTLWSLTNVTHADDPAQTVIHRQAATCEDWQTLDGPSSFQYPGSDLAADGALLYMVVAGTGIVRHEYVASVGCS